MTATAWITLALLIAMFVLLVWNKLPIWLVFIGTITVAMTLQLASPAALLKGYSNTGVHATGAISLLSERVIVLVLAPIVYGF